MPELISTGIALAFVWLFGSAAWHKFSSLDWYAGLLQSWGVERIPMRPAIRAVAAVELMVALGLLLPQLRNMALLLAALLLLAYAVMMALQLARGKASLRCGCAGPASAISISPSLVTRNLLCASVAILASIPGAAIAWSPGSAGASLLLGVFLVIVYAATERMIGNAQQFTE